MENMQTWTHKVQSDAILPQKLQNIIITNIVYNSGILLGARDIFLYQNYILEMPKAVL